MNSIEDSITSGEQLLRELMLAYLPDHVGLRITILAVATVLLALLVDRVFAATCRRLAARSKNVIDDQLIEWAHRPVFVSVLLIGAGGILKSHLAEFASAWRPILLTVAVITWFSFVWRASRLVLTTLGRIGGERGMVRSQTVHLFENLAKIVVFAGAAYLLLSAWGLDIAPLLGAAGIFGLAFGFAAKDTLANLISGVFILADAPYKIGDFVNLDSGERGQVTHIGLRSTRLLTRDDIEITIPNAVIANSTIINESGGPWEKERVRIRAGVAYGSDVDQVIGVLDSIAAAHDEIVKDPAPRVRFRGFGDSSLDFELLVWIDQPILRGRILHELNCSIYKAFGEEGIEIPFPKRDLYIKEMPALVPPREQSASPQPD